MVTFCVPSLVIMFFYCRLVKTVEAVKTEVNLVGRSTTRHPSEKNAKEVASLNRLVLILVTTFCVSFGMGKILCQN